MAKFIDVQIAGGVFKTVSVDSISSFEPYLAGTKITLKEVKNGEPVELVTGEIYSSFRTRLNSIIKA